MEHKHVFAKEVQPGNFIQLGDNQPERVVKVDTGERNRVFIETERTRLSALADDRLRLYTV